jgi:hypothetical protein
MKIERKDWVFTITKFLVLGGICIAFVAPISYVFTESSSDKIETN